MKNHQSNVFGHRSFNSLKIGIVIISFKNPRSSTNSAENHMKGILSVCVMNNIKYRKMIIFDILNERFLLLNSNSIYVPLMAALYTLTYKKPLIDTS